MKSLANLCLFFEGQCYCRLLSKAVEGSETGERPELISLFKIKTILGRNIFENSDLRLKEIQVFHHFSGLYPCAYIKGQVNIPLEPTPRGHTRIKKNSTGYFSQCWSVFESV